jgi:hypothetical protein
MADIKIEVIPNKPKLPLNDDEAKKYGELNYIFYPGISECVRIRLTNTGEDALTPELYFDRTDNDSKFWKTMRVYPTCDATLPSGVFDTGWSDEIAGNGTKDLYVYSDCTKEGFSWKYPEDHWSYDGLTVIDGNFINDREEQGGAIDCDISAAGSYLVLDTQTILPSGTGLGEEFVRVKFSVDAAVNATFNIQYSDDNATWTTVYTGADLSIVDNRYQVTFWWDRAGSHRYWRLYKTNDAAAGGNITDIQWLLFEAHKDAYDYGVYGDHSALMRDAAGYMDDFEWKTSVMVNIDVFSRQNYNMPIGKVGNRTKMVMKNFKKYGQTVQLYYIPTMTFSYGLNARSDYQLEKRVWNVRAFLTPQKRNLTYTAAADGLQPSLYRYEQRNIYLEPYGPDQVGWYQTNYDFWHAYGHSYYVLFDNRCYKLDNPQPVYLDDELVGFNSRIFLQSDMVNIATDPRNYILTNRDGLFRQFPNGGYSLPEPTDWLDTNTPEQRPARWAGAYITYVYSRPLDYSNRPDPYALAGVTSGDTYPAGEIYITQDWNNPANTNFDTSNPVAFGARVDNTATAVYFQMPRFYNWLGYCDATGLYDVINTLVQLYLDEDCTIPGRLNLESQQVVAKIENSYDKSLVSNTGIVTLTALGGTIYTDGHLVRTPSKLYVRYIPEDGHIAYHYP